jgi:hypothetical protein
MPPAHSLSVAGLLALAISVPVQAKVSHSLLLCLAPQGTWLTPTTQERLQELAASVTATTRTYGSPESALSSSVELNKNGLERLVRQDLEYAVIHHLRSLNVELGSHELFRSSASASPEDFGCKPTEVAVEIEVLFKHPLQ